MNSEIGELKTSYTKRGTRRYEIEILHRELNKFQLVLGDDPSIVKQKARFKINQWDEMWRKRENKKKEERIIKDRKTLAEKRTREAKSNLKELGTVLERALKVDNNVDWETLKDHSYFVIPKPDYQPPLPPVSKITSEPLRSKLSPGLFDRIFPWWKKVREKTAERKFEKAYQNWMTENEQALIAHQEATKRHALDVADYKKNFEAALVDWERKRQEFHDQKEETNDAIDRDHTRYQKKEPRAILDYCEIVLSNSQYPDYFPKSFDLDYNPANQLLLVDYQLPGIADIPTIHEIKYVQVKNDFSEKHLSQTQLNRLYDDLLYQITLRTHYELYAADQINAISSIVFNGYIKTIDPSTGHEINPCVVSLQTNKEEFLQINLADVDPKACFKRLKGIGSSKLHTITPVAPIVRMEREDRRFVDSYEVTETLSEGNNLAAIDWQDFEHLVRELFEKEFKVSGGEVKVTQASRDGGIDAVVFDPDPFRGGKIVLQAKRYTNTVSVSAVRDLYGAVINEGANKGILVTTSDYGPDAYNFAKGKPLQLLNGGNLLHLLEKHGHKARIDLREAKNLHLGE